MFGLILFQKKKELNILEIERFDFMFLVLMGFLKQIAIGAPR